MPPVGTSLDRTPVNSAPDVAPVGTGFDVRLPDVLPVVVLIANDDTLISGMMGYNT